MKRKRKAVIPVAFFLVLAGVLSGVLYLWLVVTNRTFVWASSYRVAVSERPGVWGRLYRLPHGERLVFDRPSILPPGKHVLVLGAGPSRNYEGYYVDLEAHTIGIPGFAPDMFVPLFHSAAVYDGTLEGCCHEAILVADWDVKDSGKEVHIRIKGFKAAAGGSPQWADAEAYAHKMIPIGYQNEIVLRK